jgi:catechol 2,3-dioxygenase-like lactoylglutathione lyase family enzyme
MVTTTGLAEIVLMVQDIQKSQDFYRDVLGLKVISPQLGGPVFLQAGEDRAGVPHQIVLVPRPPEAPDFPAERALRSFHHLGLELPRGSLQETQRQLEAQGYEVRIGEHPFLPVEAIYIDDPDGNEVELVARR